MDIEGLLRACNIDYVSYGQHHHVTEGWVNIHCPFCSGSRNYHLGINLEKGNCYCWRCGSHKLSEVLQEVLKISYKEANRLITKYRAGGPRIAQEEANRKVKIKPLRLPPNIVPLQKNHRYYLIKRKFDPDVIAQLWGVQGIGPASILDGIDFSNRLFIPVYWDGELVSFQARAISNKEPKYLFCPKDRQLVNPKDIIYGNPDGWADGVGICVEGVTDVWRLGKKAFATFGIDYRRPQIRCMAKIFKKVFVMFDGGEVQAQKKAKRLVDELSALGVDAYQVVLKEGDPGELSQEEANRLVKDLLKSGA